MAATSRPSKRDFLALIAVALMFSTRGGEWLVVNDVVRKREAGGIGRSMGMAGGTTSLATLP